MKRRLFSLFLALTLVVGMLPAPAFAQETEPTQVTEAPTEAPATEAPATEAPATEAPATEVPATEAPATEAPAAEPTPAPTEALAPETTVAPAPTEAPTEPAPTEDEAVAAVQAMIDALPDVDHMSEEYIDALEEAYSAYETLSESQQAQITGVEKLEALFNWVNSQVSTLADEVMEISGEVTWNNQTITTPVKLTGETTLTLTGTNRIECDQPLDLNGKNLTIQGTGTLELVGKGGSYFRVDATLCDSTYTSNNIGGALTLAGGTVKVSGSDQNAVCVYNLKLNGGKLEAYGGKNAGIACTLLQTTSGSLYATGDDYGICMYRPNYGAAVNKLTILVSNKKDADIAKMESADENAIAKAGIGDFRTVYIGEVSGPLLSVKAQKGYLYEGTAKTATFALSGRNVDLSALTLEWTGTYTGLTASADGKTLTVTTDETVQAGTYGLKVSAGEASKTVVVTVSGPPIRILTQPVDTISTDPEAGAVTVSACPTDGRTGSIDFQWKREDGTPMVGYTEETVRLYGMDDEGMLTQDASKPWLKSIRIYCTLSYDGYSLDTDTVTLGLSSCPHEKVNHEGICLQCGQKKGGNKDALLVKEDGLYHLIANAEPGEADVGLFMYSGGNFYLTGDVPHKIVNVSCTDVGGKNVTLDLQGHMVNSLQMGNFPYGTFTVKNGTLGVIDTDASGKLILENIHYKDPFISALFDLTVQGENTRFEWPVVFLGTTHLKGGHFEQGLDPNCVDRALELLEEGFAFYDSANEVVDATDSAKLVGREIHVASHICSYRYGKCDCGRSCDHSTVSDETGLCQKCGSQVYEANVTTADGSVTGYRTLEEALRNGRNATVKLLADCVAEETDEAFYVKVPLTLDLNGKRMEGHSGLVVQKGPTTIQDSSPAKTGTIAGTKDWEYSGVGLWVFKDAEVTLTILGGHFEGKTDGLQLAGQNTLILQGGSFSSMHFIEGATATLRDSLASGYAYYKADNTLYDPGEGQEATVRLHVGAHPEHTPDSSGHCPCGYTVAATLVTDAGKQYFADFGDALEAAKAASGSTLTLFQDVALTNNITIDSGTFTIDWNGHTLSGETSNALLCITDAAKVTLTDSIGTGGLRNVGGAAIGAYVGSPGSLTIQGGVYSPQLWKDRIAYGSIQISGGEFQNPEDSGRNGALYCYSGSLAELLAPGYTFAYEDDELFNVYQRKSDIYRTVYVVEHTHENWTDGVCDCGYTCPHEHWTDGMCDLCGKVCDHDRYENGKCTVCGYPCPHEDVTENGGVYTCDICGLTMTVMVETADGNVSYTTDLAAALNDAEDGTTVKLLGDVSLEKNADIIGGNKTVTLNLNSHNISQKTWQTISVEGNTGNGTKTKLIIKGSGDLPRAVNVFASGKLDLSGWTGTATYVNLSNVCELVGPTGDGYIGELSIGNWRNGNVGSIVLQGGSIGQLWLNSFEDFQIPLGSLLKAGYAAKSGSEYLPYDRAIVYSYSGTSDNILNDLTIEPCTHPNPDSSGRCTYCNTTGFVATVTKDGVTAGYTDFQSALGEICDGKRGTLKLLKDVPVEEGYHFGRISGTLDLNGKNLACELTCIQGSNLQIVNRGSIMSEMGKLFVWNGAKVTIADTAGSILFSKVTVESGSVANLLPEGSAYFSFDRQTWISTAEAAKKTLENVAVKEVPVKSVTLTANKTSVPYGESQTVSLSAAYVLGTNYAIENISWCEVFPAAYQDFTETGTSFTLPAGVNVGEHTYRVSVTAGGYTLSKDIQITVTKAQGTLVNKNYPTQFTYGETVPTPKAENFITNNPDGEFDYYWITETGSTLEAGANPISAGTYTLNVKVASSGNYETVWKSFTVTVSPLEITDENIVYDLGEALIYNGKSQTAAFRSITVNGMRLNYTLTGNTATDAGSYTMTVTGQGSFIGSVEIPWKIQPRVLTYAKITQGDSLTYNGREQTRTVASVTVEGMDSPLTPGVDFQVSGNTGTNAGEYTLTVRGNGNFTGTQTAKWTIAPLDINTGAMFAYFDNLTYNGEAQTPKVVKVELQIGAKTMEITYDVDVTPQVNAGKYKLAIIGTGNFTGRRDRNTWEIKPKDMSNAEVVLGPKLTYNGKQQTQIITSVTVDGLSVDYTVTGNVGLDAQGYVLTVTGSGNFTGRKYVPWAIARKDIANAKITLGDSLTYNFEKQTQTIASVTVGDLNVPTYTVIGNTGTDAGEYTLTVVADGNFTGTQTAKWNIAPMDISNERVLIQSNDVSRGLIYNGEEQTPNIALAQVLNAEAKKYLAITFQVDVTPQVNVGRYTLGIIGTGNFTGRKDGFTWKINPKDMSNAEVVLGDSLTYNGQQQTQTIRSVTVDGLDVTYRVVADSNTGTNADWYDLTLAGTGNFDGIWHDEWEIAKKDVTIENTAVESTKVYDGTTVAMITNIGTPSDNYDGDGLQIVPGTAAYDNKNVGTGKTVTFTGFSLTGDRAGNYRLVSQPASVTADITAKEITLTVSVKDKDFDGTTKAELDTVTHTDFVAGDDVELVNGEPSFAYPCVRADIPIRFTDFRLTGSDADNYRLTNAQPEGVTAEIHPTPNYLDVTDKPEFDGKTTVTVDGVEYPIEEVDGERYVSLPETGDLLTIYSFKDGTPEGSYTNYPTGMQVFRITRQEGGAKAEEITEFANLLNYAGCSIRLTGTKGIRMITGISENARTALTGARGLGGYTLEEYGTVVMRGVGTPTLENSKSHNFAYKKGKADPVFARVGGMIQYTNVLVGFGLEDCKDTLTLRPYIKLKDMTTGETVTLYGGCVSRSIGYIARQNANTYQPGTAGYKYIHEIIDAVYGKTEQGGETK